VLSRNAAEHLSRPRPEVADIIRRSFGWFGEVGLGQPRLYVPPAWAMGAVKRADLDRLPFRFYETLGGIYDSQSRRMRRLPLVGYEADTAGRALALRLVNGLNRQMAASLGRPLRVAIHPSDFDLRLAADLRSILDRCHPSIGCDPCATEEVG
jgi:predicted deacetylase